jgi:hypothetical protein
MRNDMKDAGPAITPMCVRCGAEYSPLRRKAGYTICLSCGESELCDDPMGTSPWGQARGGRLSLPTTN